MAKVPGKPSEQKQEDLGGDIGLKAELDKQREARQKQMQIDALRSAIHRRLNSFAPEDLIGD